jgi:hypothetical protein
MADNRKPSLQARIANPPIQSRPETLEFEIVESRKDLPEQTVVKK